MYVSTNLFSWLWEIIFCFITGPICRRPFQQNGFHVAYDLEEASRLFALIKTQFDISTIHLKPVSEADLVRTSEQEMIHNDEVFARRLQAELNQATPTRVVVSGNNTITGNLKGCRHHCDLVSTRQCCKCSGKRNIFIDAILLLTWFLSN